MLPGITKPYGQLVSGRGNIRAILDLWHYRSVHIAKRISEGCDLVIAMFMSIWVALLLCDLRKISVQCV
ncbi:hypothetical protein SERLADRAFT_463810 [Serpula lacrymans var. lacrymans S7.9]|uniref:Uncharacterized protein n=1 Tax=Serpula lacrymans var. lacrymans (strain S7.9) TaxID=578457 RepID=F8NQK2_SERL9|nr:uncharacterized protein SERLADRAFT_463810 [Serpula lacrymans var. lacrymans S7.9]EGO26608.1 hypothetical protein SERLADRAFT_463810 [Serpula lacrymans var. lacrymans S7.9]